MQSETAGPIYRCIQEDEIEEFQKFIAEEKLSLDGEAEYFHKPFISLALDANAIKIFTWLLQQNVSIEGRSFGRIQLEPVLYSGFINGREKCVSLLLEHRANLHELLNNEEKLKSIISSVCSARNLPLLEILIKNGVDLKAFEKKESCIWLAISSTPKSKDIDFIRYLFKHGADINWHGSDYRRPPLLAAINSARKDIFEFLWRQGADPKQHPKRYGSIIIQLIENLQPTADLVKKLIDLGVDVNAKDHEQFSALMVAAVYNNVPVIEALVKNGADMQAIDREGDSALHFALMHEAVDAAIKLIELGADVDFKNKNNMSAYDYCSKLRKSKGDKNLIEIIESHSQQHDASDTRIPLDIDAGEAWADRAIDQLNAMPMNEGGLWRELIQQLSTGSSAKPGKTWNKKALELAEKIGVQSVQDTLCDWLSLLNAQRTSSADYDELSGNWHFGDTRSFITDYNTRVLRGVMWLFALMPFDGLPGLLRDIAQSMFKKVYGVGMRNAKIANGALYALSQLPGDDGVKEIAILRAQTKYNPALVNINRVFERIAKERKVSAKELEELAVSDYDLTDIGVYEKTLGDFVARLEMTAVGKSQLTWLKGDKIQRTVPAAVKRDFAQELKRLKSLSKDLNKASLAYRNRLERGYLEEKHWSIAEWRERYIDHLLGGYLGRRLIWQLKNGKNTQRIIWHNGEFITSRCENVQPDDYDQVCLWHPLFSSEEEVFAWRNWLNEAQITQPLRQAYREIYILTDAERNTRDHSMRFANHIIKQHQFNALAQDRGWRQTLGGYWDGGWETEAYRKIPNTNYSVEFSTEPFNESATTANGIFYFLTTHRLSIVDDKKHEAVPLEKLSAIIFSELMRDVDLFVSVANVGNDPDWEYRANNNLWEQCSFGELTALSKTRKAVLEGIIPKLKIHKQLRIEDRYLYVQGKLASYKIHIGSGNIRMHPSNAYLCIVSTRDKSGKIYLPFEGDHQISVILSKAFLLAEDDKIKDETILSQIQPNRTGSGDF